MPNGSFLRRKELLPHELTTFEAQWLCRNHLDEFMATERPKILCLGVSYANIEAELQGREFTLSVLGEADGSTVSSETAIKCVEHKILNQMDGRDLARCLATEELCDVDVYCVSQEKGAKYRADRHLDANFNRSSFVKEIQKHFMQCRFDQIILDYFWIPAGWDVHHWSMKFFETTLIDIAKAQLVPILPLSPSTFNGSFRRGIYLPFCFHCFKSIVAFGEKIKQYFNISFLRKNELNCVALWSGTQCIDSVQMQNVLGKRKDQEEVYCTFGARHIKEMESGSASKEELFALASSLEDFPDIRFIILEPLHISTLFKSPKTPGRFLGLVQQSKVRRGIQHSETVRSSSLSTSLKRRMSFQCENVNTPKKTRRYNLRNQSPSSTLNFPSSLEKLAKRSMQPKVLFPDV
jgi:hypothetical protein